MHEKTAKCPSCGYVKTMKGEPGETVNITCPSCHKVGSFQFSDDKKTTPSEETPSAITIVELTKTYGTIPAVDHASFQIHKGEIFGFLGPNGAGKTTTIKAILGLLYPTQGEIRINGTDIFSEEKKVKSQIGYLPEKVSFYDNLTALQNLMFYAEMKHVSKECCMPLLKEFGLGDDAKKKVRAFSKGMTQRLGMARAVLGNPSILILDEPSNGLDPRGVVFIREKIKHMQSLGSTVLVSSHILSEIQEMCDRVCIINKGRIVAVDNIMNLGTRLQLRPRIIIQLDNVTAEVVKAVEHIKEVDHVETKGNSIEITCLPTAKAQIILSVVQAKGNIINIQTKEPTLEDVFMRFTEE
jgi:ABC-type multidrug transport system ATPase subunit